MKRYGLPLLSVACLIGAASFALRAQEGAESEFTSPTVDFGIVVSDVDGAIEFYTEALGLTEVGGFDVSAEMGRDAGLADNKPFHVTILNAGSGPGATAVKIMEFEGTDSETQDNEFIHSTLGVSYLTFHVADMSVSMERLEAADVEPLAEGPYALQGGAYLTLVRDPDGNFVELVGPSSKEL